MIDKQLLTETVEKAIANTDLFIVDIRITPDNNVTVELDSSTSIDIDTCAGITRAIHAAIDPDVEDYELEVGSAGLTSPFKVKGQYLKNIGNEVEVLTRDGRKFSGVLTDAADNTFTVEVQRKEKQPGQKRPVMVTVPETLAYTDAKKVCYLLKFK
ncbi:MAG: ribosome assembly cofactor RimP [Muribaculaceae bacterium]|nr:ribosome assembly cofactor RimP [Muribaculaceae bacterium]